MPWSTRRSASFAVWALVALAGMAAGWWGTRRERARALDNLRDDARRCALAFDAGEVGRLAGSGADLSNPAYLAVKARLVRLRRGDPSIRHLLLVRWLRPTGKVVVLADAEPPGSRRLAPPGERYAGAPELRQVLASIRRDRSVVAGPLTDASGLWLRGYAPVPEHGPGSSAVRAEDVLVVERSAEHWRRNLVAGGLRDAVGVWLVLGLPLGGLVMARRRRRQHDLVQKLARAVELSRTAVVITRADRRVEYVNAVFCDITGWRREEILGWSLDRLVAGEGSPDGRRPALLDTVKSGCTWREETVNPRRDGTTYPARCVASPVHDRSGRLTHIITAIEDVTERRQVEATLTYAAERAEAGERAKGQFLTTMSHEIRTPLNGIIGFTDLLLGTSLTPEQRDCVQTIRSSGEELLKLTGDVLDYSSIDAGRLSLEPQPCSPLECVESVLEEFAVRAAAKRLELLHWAAPAAPAAVLLDTTRLRQILVNLVGNAVKFTLRGEVEVSLDAKRRPDYGREARAGAWNLTFAVRDTGVGIPPEIRSRLFKPFSQGDATTTRKYSGAGLGLVITQSLVQMMRGDMTIESEVGRGTVATFTVVADEVPGAAAPAPVNLADRMLALVCGSPGLRRELHHLAADWGARVAEFESAAVAAGTWDLAVVDLATDDLDAWMRMFIERPELSSRPMAALVPADMSEPERDRLGGFFRVLLRKPIRHRVLGVVLENGLEPAPVAPPPPAVSGGSLGLRALLVDHNPVNQRLIQKMLEILGCHWDLAEDGRLALLRLDRGTYDLVLLNLHLAEMDGLAVIEQIRRGRAGARNRDIWITAIAGDEAETQRVRTVTGGADDCLTGPLKLAELEAAMRRCLTRPERGR